MAASLLDKSVRDLLAAFSSNDPTPGGGSAAALSSAVGTSLLMMVASLPKTRSNADQERTALHGVMTTLTGLRQQLAEAIDADTDAYDQVVAAFKLSKATPEQVEARKAAIQRALKTATDVPLGVLRLSVRALEASAVVAANGHKAAASDVGVAAALLLAGATGARLNVEINLDGITDVTYADAVRSEVRTLAADADRAASTSQPRP